MKYFLLLTILVALSLNLFSTNISGPITQTVWTLQGSPYNVIGDCTLPANQNLTINAGVQVVINQDCGITILGNLTVNGTSSARVSFKPATGATWEGIKSGQWEPITVHPSVNLKYCDITGIRNTEFVITAYRNSLFSMTGCKVYNNTILVPAVTSMSHCAILNIHNQYSINPNVETVIIENNEFYSNHSEQTIINTTTGGGIIYINGSTSISFRNNSIHDNNPTSSTLAFWHNLSFYIMNNTITNNKAICEGYNGATAYSGGMEIFVGIKVDADREITNNTITYNEGLISGGMYLQGKDMLVEKNTIAFNRSNENGGGIYLYSYGGNFHDTNTGKLANYIKSNKIYENTAMFSGGGLYIERAANNPGWPPEDDNNNDYVIEMTDNQIYKNISYNSGGGIAFKCWTGVNFIEPVTFRNNEIFQNTTYGTGGGIFNQSCELNIENCNIVDNQANNTPTGENNGDAIYATGLSLWTAINSINSIFYKNALYLEIGTFTLNHCSFDDVNSYPADITTVTDPVYGDPGFVDPWGYKYQLALDNAWARNGAGGQYTSYIGVYPYDVNKVTSTFTKRLHNKYNWVSFPILDRQGNLDENTLVTVGDVLASINPNGYGIADVGDNSSLFNLDFSIWNGQLAGIQSSNGYKLDMTNGATLNNRGTTLYPNTVMTLQPLQDNWVGYFIPESIQPLNAIPTDIIDNVLSIKTEYWAMNRTNNPDDPWLYTKTAKDTKIVFNFGDMVSITTNALVDLVWQNSIPEIRYERPEAKIFTFETQADYTPVYVDINPDNLPKEAAVFVNGVCKGAAVVEGDVTEINAYFTEEDLGQEVTFSFAYDAKASPVGMNNYYVINANQGYDFSTLIHKADEKFYHVSFNAKQNQNAVQKINLSQNYPNPFNPSTTICYSLNKDSNVNLEIYNIKGQKVKSLYQGFNTAGKHEVVWNGKDNHNKSVSSGIYLYRLTSDNKVVQKKMSLIK